MNDWMRARPGRVIPALALGLMAVAAGAANPESASDPTTRTLYAQLGMTRLQAANRSDGLWAGGATRVSPLLEPQGPGDGELFARSLAQSTEAVIRHGDRALTGWRDPLTDVWLVAEWSYDPALSAWRIERTTLALTQDLAPVAGADEQPLAPLLPRVGELGVGPALALAHHQAVAAFRRAATAGAGALPWDADPRAVRAREVALLRLDAAREARLALQRAAPDAAEVVNVALVEETPAVRTVSDSIARALAALPTEVRLSLRIVAALPARGQVLAVVQSPLQPSLLYVAHLRQAGGAAQVTNVESIDLAKAE